MSQLDLIPEIRLRAIKITGPDAVAFMKSQLTIDLDAIADSRLYPAAWCSPNGRVDAILLVAVEDEDVYLVLPEALAAPTVKRAKMYSIGRKVALQEDVAAYPADASPVDDRLSLALALDPARSLIIARPGENPDQRAGGLTADWLRADVESAMPWILPETAGAYLPQMLGLETLGGLSYKKGCFPGQEVIARVHYRGRVTRRTTRFRLDADSPPAAGREFELAGKSAQVLYALAEPGKKGSIIGLAVVAAEAEPRAEIGIGSSAGTLF